MPVTGSRALAVLVVIVMGFTGPVAASTTDQASGPMELVDVTRSVGLPTDRAAANLISTPDVDGDGDRDLYLNGGTDDAHTVFRNDGGSFTAMLELPALGRYGCTWGDVDGDVLVDGYCTVSSSGGSPNELWVQQPDGAFTESADAVGVADPGGRGRTPAFLDVDGDGDLDLFVGNKSRGAGDRDSMNRLFVNDGHGRFSEDASSAARGPHQAFCAVTADVDADGWTDLLVCGGGSTGLRWYEAGPQGLTARAVPGGLRGFSRDVAITDLTADGRLDVVLIDRSEVQIHRQEADGSFSQVVRHELENGWAVDTGDFDGDGRRDVYVLQASGSQTRDHVLLGRADGSFATTTPTGLADAGDGVDIAAIDVDGDAVDEVVVVESGEDGSGRARLLSLRVASGPDDPPGDPSPELGTGSWSMTDVIDGSGVDDGRRRSYEPGVMDVDGDGDMDLYLDGHYSHSHVLYRNDGGTFSPLWSMPLADRHGCTWADVDGDGRIDAFCSVGADGGTATGANELWIQRADGSFVDRAGTWGVQDPNGRGRASVLFDADGDGWPDLFLGNKPGRRDGAVSTNRLYINDRGRRFVEDTTTPLRGEFDAHCAQAVDVDGDGWTDLLLCASGSAGGLRLFRNGPQGFTDVTASVRLGGFARDAAVADVTGDGRADVVQISRTHASIHEQRADGRFQRVLALDLVDGSAVEVGDVDGDGHDDIYIVQASNPDADDLLLTRLPDGGWDVVGRTSPRHGTGGAAAMIDVDGDGSMEVLVTNGRGSARGRTELISFDRD